MPKDTSAGQAGLTRGDVEGIVGAAMDAVAKRFQSQLTPVQQRNAGLDIALASIQGRLDEMGRHPTSSAGGEPAAPPVPGPESWNDVGSGADLYGKVEELVEAKLRGRGDSTDPRVDVLEQNVNDMALEKQERQLLSNYPWMDDGHVRQLLQVADQTGLVDLSYHAYHMYGAPGTAPEDPNAVGEGGREASSTTPPRQQAGGAAMLSGASGGTPIGAVPETVQIRRGIQGYADVERHAIDWAKRNGKL